ncbi:MAG: hypothetical protein ACXW2U_10325 [Telluria sp.]
MADAGDEIAAIGQVDVIGAGRDGGAGDVVILSLERPGGVDDGQNLQRGEALGARGVGVDCQRLRGGQSELTCEMAGLIGIATADLGGGLTDRLPLLVGCLNETDALTETLMGQEWEKPKKKAPHRCGGFYIE